MFKPLQYQRSTQPSKHHQRHSHTHSHHVRCHFECIFQTLLIKVNRLYAYTFECDKGSNHQGEVRFDYKSDENAISIAFNTPKEEFSARFEA